MVKYTAEGLGKVLILNLKRGDLLLETIETELKESGIANALITGAIGSLQKAVFHRVIGTGPKPEDEYITVEKPLELASLQGIVLDYKAHFHMVISDVEKAYSGHLEPGTTVLYLSEITLVEIKGAALHRVKDENGIGVIKEMEEIKG